VKQTNAISIMITVLLVFFISSCNNTPAQQYGTTMTQSLKSAKSVEVKANADAARKAIQDFYAVYGKYPADLAEVASVTGIPLKSDKYDYNPESGALTEK